MSSVKYLQHWKCRLVQTVVFFLFMTEFPTQTIVSDLPSVTRMLLRSDGSMTRLLEALVDRPLALDLTDQHVSTGRCLSPPVRAALGCAEAETVIVRTSTLVTAEGAAVSVNYVAVLVEDDELTALLTDPHRPIGHSLAAADRHLARTVLGSGVTRWPAPGDAEGLPCVYKESVLCDHLSRPVAHLHERLNPTFVPLEEKQ